MQRSYENIDCANRFLCVNGTSPSNIDIKFVILKLCFIFAVLQAKNNLKEAECYFLQTNQYYITVDLLRKN
jgi:hypothetical protein